MKPIEEEAVLKDHNGCKVLHGAGGVDTYKEKNGEIVHQPRFVSIFCPINDYLSHIISDEADLPYVSQISL